ncbi:MAG TPA: carbohydrate kinase family protein [Acidobacteriaceae bacterium]
MLALRANAESGFTCAIGIGGIGSGIMYSLHGEHDLGRNESRLGELLDSRDYCKLHILEHYIARLMGSDRAPGSFRVLPIGVVGNDAIGTQILTEMSAAGLDMQFVRSDPALKTLFSVCFIYPDGSGGNITSSNSAAQTLSVDDLRAASPCMKTAGPRAVALCVPEVPLELRRHFLELATHCGNYRVCSFVLGDIEGALRMGLIALTDLLALNQEEASSLFSSGSGHILDERLLVECAATYTATHPLLRMVVSVGAKGAYGFERGRTQFCPAPVLQPKSTAGAGDALLAGVVCALAAGIPFIMPNECGNSFSDRVLRTALDFGVLNASFSVTSTHSIHPDAVLKNLFAFAELQGASLSESFRWVCYESEQASPETVSNLA